MAIQVNTNAEHRTPMALAALVAAVRAADPADEASWIEWKSALPLADLGSQFIIARAILGLANRSAQAAGRYMRGLGYVIVGAQPESAAGVDSMDASELGPKLAVFLGGTGQSPQWSPHYVPLEGSAAALVIVVEAPRQGDPIFPLRKAYQPPGKSLVPEGTIFVRDGSITRPHTSADLDLLVKRALPTITTKPLDISVAFVPGAEPRPRSVDLSDEAVSRWRAGRRSRLLDELGGGYDPAEDVPTVTELAGVFRSGAGSTGAAVARYERFVRQIDTYLDGCTAVLPAMARRQLVRSDAAWIELEVHNRGTNLTGVQVVLDAQGWEPLRWPDDVEFDVPDKPAAFERHPVVGLYPMLNLGGAGIAAYMPNLASAARPRKPPWLDVEDTADGARLVFEVGDLRPGETCRLPGFHVVTTDAAGSSLPVAWRSTCKSTDDIATDTLTIRMFNAAIPVDDLLGDGDLPDD